jgi:hypothetical protein
MNRSDLNALPKTEIPEKAKNLGPSDVDFLVQALAEKDEPIRYNAFLLLQANSREFPLVYAHWADFEKKLENPNSRQRGAGLMLIAENVRWDKDCKFAAAIGKYLACCVDEKFITARQAIQGLSHILASTNTYDNRIKRSLTNLSLDKYKGSQQKLLKKDVSNILKMIDDKSRVELKSAKQSNVYK